MNHFTPGDRVRLARIHPLLPFEARHIAGSEGRVSGLRADGTALVAFPEYGDWPVPRDSLDNLSRPSPIAEPPQGTASLSGLPGASGLLALSSGGIRLRAVDALYARWGREVWRARTFEETSRYEVLLGGRRVGDVWRATGQSYRSERHVWLAAPAGHPDHVASTVTHADDLQSTRRRAALNVAGAAALAFEVDGATLLPIAIVSSPEGGHEAVRYLVRDGDADPTCVVARWRDRGHAGSPGGYDIRHPNPAGEPGNWPVHLDPVDWEGCLAEAVRGALGRPGPRPAGP